MPQVPTARLPSCVQSETIVRDELSARRQQHLAMLDLSSFSSEAADRGVQQDGMGAWALVSPSRMPQSRRQGARQQGAGRTVRVRTEVPKALDLIAAVVEHACLHARLLPRHGREPLAAIALAPLVAWVVVVGREGQPVALCQS